MALEEIAAPQRPLDDDRPLAMLAPAGTSGLPKQRHARKSKHHKVLLGDEVRAKRRRKLTGAETVQVANDNAKFSNVKAGIDDETRSKVVGMLMRTFATGCGQVHFENSSEIEQELFGRLGTNAREYKRRARTIVFNLAKVDGQLIQKVLTGDVGSTELVQLQTEDLVPALKAERQEQRERYFREEIHLTCGPPKSRRHLHLQSENSQDFEEPQAHDTKDMEHAIDQDSQDADRGDKLSTPMYSSSANDVIVPMRKSESMSGSEANSSSDSDSDSDSVESLSSIVSLHDWPDELPQTEGIVSQSPTCDDADDFAIASILQAEFDLESASSSSASEDSQTVGCQEIQHASSSSSSSPLPTRDPHLVDQDILTVDDNSLDEGIAQLITMGFTAEDARTSLQHTSGNVDEAIAMLLELQERKGAT